VRQILEARPPKGADFSLYIRPYWPKTDHRRIMDAARGDEGELRRGPPLM
jgi:hypothetical protein